MEGLDYEILLKMITGAGSKAPLKLIARFGDAEGVMASDARELLKVEGISKKVLKRVADGQREMETLVRRMEALKAKGVDCITYSNPQYPQRLKQIFNPPFGFYRRGDFQEVDEKAVAIVGARRATPYGKKVAYDFAADLARAGVTVVSGMAHGIDTEAHKGALENGGRTIAVLGSGLNVCYPKSNLKLMQQIAGNGAVLSEYEWDAQPLSKHFPVRNRVISGLSLGVIVVEANMKSGSLITANFALDQGKDVFAVPGNINSKLSEGTNQLIRDGAYPALNIEHILETLNMKFIRKTVEKELDLSYTEEIVCNFIIENQPAHISKLELGLDLSAGELSAILTIMEMKGIIEQFPGKIFVAK